MEGRQHSNDQLPEVVEGRVQPNMQHPHEDFEYYEPPQPGAAPEYSQETSAPPFQSQQSTNPTSERTSSPAAVDYFVQNPPQKERPLSPQSLARYSEISSPGLQNVYGREGEKEVYQSTYPVAATPTHSQFEQEERRRRICGLPKKWFLILAGLILLAIIAVAAALGAVFGTKHS